MDDYPAKIADFVESIAVRIRELTVDRIAVAISWAALGIIMLVMGLVAVVFALIGLLRILGELVGTEWAYVILGGLFLVIAAFLWRMRNPESGGSSQVEAAKTAETSVTAELIQKQEVPGSSQVAEATKTDEATVTAKRSEAPEPPEVQPRENP